MYKNYFLSCAASMLLCQLLTFTSVLSQDRVIDVNHLFIAGLFLLMVSAVIYVVNSGFFHLFFIGFQQLKKGLFREPEYMKEINIGLTQWKQRLYKGTASFAGGIGTGLVVLSTYWSF
ncbi:DUF3899 domain-containing protein [Peribacillus psychrosaccharolyticus]|uniref:DUF3899 domain-containing protein n=3 Tax=Peribacillus psychrosaccharolyticus TaxID=1407 RepID=A0A974RZU5_PERPY|nr:DUF3899 domain-containing protein [Peribacillus psychrosaccharolyticus]MEC2054436.1 DUF3899 domain-containing protein [Peribacillus psychrosaccharolyticus]QQS99815.1 DUF3899 domain-containing protein [Peribacillus psychrosaccharolyticus]